MTLFVQNFHRDRIFSSKSKIQFNYLFQDLVTAEIVIDEYQINIDSEIFDKHCLFESLMWYELIDYCTAKLKFKLIFSIMEMTQIIQIGKELGLQGTALLDFIERKEKESLDREERKEKERLESRGKKGEKKGQKERIGLRKKKLKEMRELKSEKIR